MLQISAHEADTDNVHYPLVSCVLHYALSIVRDNRRKSVAWRYWLSSEHIHS